MHFGDIAGLESLAEQLGSHARRFGSAAHSGDAAVGEFFSHGDEPQLPSIKAFSVRWAEVRRLLSELERAADRCSSVLETLARQLSRARTEWEPAVSHALSIGAIVVEEGTHTWVTPPLDATPGNAHVYSTISRQLQDAKGIAHSAWSTALAELDAVPTVHAGDLVKAAASNPPVDSGSSAVDAELRRLLPEILSAGLTATALR